MYFAEPFGAGFVDSVEIGVFSHYGATMHSFLFHRKLSLALIYWWLSFCFYVFPMCNDKLHMLLLNFCVCSLVSETIPDHRDYRLYVGEKAKYRRRLFEVVSELELLKPEVQKQVDQINNPYSKPSSSSSNFFSSDLSAPPSAPYARNQSYGNANYDKFGSRSTQDLLTGFGNPGSAVYCPPPLQDQFNNFSLSTLNIPRPRDETLSRHSFLASSSNQNRREHQQVRVCCGCMETDALLIIVYLGQHVPAT
jgi:hypothetical protein